MNNEMEVFKAIANSTLFKTVLSGATFLIVSYMVSLARKMYRKQDYIYHKMEAMHTASIEVLNGKGKEYEELVEIQMEAWRKQVAYTEAPPLWKFK